MERPADWVEFVNEPQTEEELVCLRESVNRGRPFGDDRWLEQAAAELELETTLRPVGRPRKQVLDERNDS